MLFVVKFDLFNATKEFCLFIVFFSYFLANLFTELDRKKTLKQPPKSTTKKKKRNKMFQSLISLLSFELFFQFLFWRPITSMYRLEKKEKKKSVLFAKLLIPINTQQKEKKETSKALTTVK
jgi:hypothetical protein